ncbi:hypothetical protein ACSAZK_12205 [Methanosarcina sp. Mfa9]|uniref:hypothetical protein n=1 Tax=Methanosarcina sp. Mfa9 TaxID=3439063 RepID=UPI003F86F61F
MVKEPEIKSGGVEVAVYSAQKEAPEKGAKGPEMGGDKPEPLKPGGEEFCKSCLDMPEEQRKSLILEIQQLTEKILRAHGLIKKLEDLLKGEWFLKLGKSGFSKKFVAAKNGEEIFVGLYSYSNGTPIPDPNLVLLSQYGFWYPQRIEEQFDETVCSFFTGAYGDYEYLNVIPENVVKFQAFQRDFSKVLEEHGWDGPDVEVIEKIMPKD